MFKCKECGCGFNTPDYEIIINRSEYWGGLVSEEYHEECCPDCRSTNFEEANECLICGEAVLADESISSHICQICYDEYVSDFDQVYNAMNGDNALDIKINGLVAGLLSEEEINNILHDYVKKQFGMGFCKEFNDYVNDGDTAMSIEYYLMEEGGREND